jgi:hypothetical protein
LHSRFQSGGRCQHTACENRPPKRRHFAEGKRRCFRHIRRGYTAAVFRNRSAGALNIEISDFRKTRRFDASVRWLLTRRASVAAEANSIA